MTESSMSRFFDSIGVGNPESTTLVEGFQASNPEDAGELQITYDSWHMFQSIWKSNLSINTSSFQEISMWMCFQLCYLFPRDYEFHKDDIIQLWIAEGFSEIEASAQSYFQAFQTMSIFQFSCLADSTRGRKYRVNPSIVDLLREHHEDAYCIVDDWYLEIPENIMHSLAIGTSTLLNKLQRATQLRTLMIKNEQVEQVPRDFFLKLSSLKVLDISYTNIRDLPSSIRHLIELRYLNLSGTPIEALPNALCSLYKMMTLKVRDCSKLAGLPKGMRKLKNLRHLDADVACLLVSMPPGFGDLIELQMLPAFVVGKEKGCQIVELKHLVNLCGVLHILRLENVSDANEAKEACLCNKNNVHKLELQWTDLQQDSYEILENLEPSMQLEELQIVGYGDVRFPKWIGDPIFSKLVTIFIHNCPESEHLPALGKLPLLEALTISEMHNVKFIDYYFCGRDKSNELLKGFQKLVSLTLNELPKLQNWVGIVKGDFPNLRKLHIFSCSMLMALPQFPSLNSIEKLEIRFCPSLESLPSDGLLSSLQDFAIVGCPSLSERCRKDQQELEKLAHIASVSIDYFEFSRFKSFESFEEDDDYNEEKIQTVETEMAQSLEAEVTQSSKIKLAHRPETEPVQHSENESAQLLEIESVRSGYNTKSLSSQATGIKEVAAKLAVSHTSWQEILPLDINKLLTLLTGLKRRGVGIVEPQHLFVYIAGIYSGCAEDSTNEDLGRLFLSQIREGVVLPHGVAFALALEDYIWKYILVNYDTLKVDELTLYTYSNFRRESQESVEKFLEEELWPPVEEPSIITEEPSIITEDPSIITVYPKVPFSITWPKRKVSQSQVIKKTKQG